MDHSLCWNSVVDNNRRTARTFDTQKYSGTLL
ncbi:hypothetical protein GGP73_002123 [Salinibacter ruber]|nr:hypothetical protein [Salinibacter ruber]